VHSRFIYLSTYRSTRSTDIINPSKFRRLKRHAVTTGVSGYVKVLFSAFSYVCLFEPKAGKPGVLFFHGSKPTVSSFLECVRCALLHSCFFYTKLKCHDTALRYLEFHHVDTQPLSPEQVVTLSKMSDESDTVGLEEMPDMKALVEAADKLGLKSWFRKEMGMEKGG
jgi:hypothetical protein